MSCLESREKRLKTEAKYPKPFNQAIQNKFKATSIWRERERRRRDQLLKKKKNKEITDLIEAAPPILDYDEKPIFLGGTRSPNTPLWIVYERLKLLQNQSLIQRLNLGVLIMRSWPYIHSWY